MYHVTVHMVSYLSQLFDIAFLKQKIAFIVNFNAFYKRKMILPVETALFALLEGGLINCDAIC